MSPGVARVGMNRRDIMRGSGGALALSLISGARAAVAGKPRIKVGQIGVGHAHATKLSVYRASPDYEVVGIAETDETLRKKAESHDAFSGVKVMTRDELLAIPGLQAVLVETRVRDLLENAEAAVAAGKHIHIDKPAGESLPRFRKILEDATRRKLMVQMGYMYRYNPAVVLLRQFLAKGWLGEIFEAHAVMSKVVPAPARLVLAEHKGGMMFELGCHLIDLMVGILGKPGQVYGVNQHSGQVNDGLMDNAMAVFTYPKAIASVKTTALEVNGGERRHLVVCGSAGTFHIQPLDNPSARVTLAEDRPGYKKGTQEIKFPKYTRYEADALDMARVIRGEMPDPFGPGHDLAVQETVLRACGLATG